MLYNLAASSAFIAMALNPVKVQRASLDVVRNAFDIVTFMRRCTVLLYAVSLHSIASDSIHTGKEYNRNGRIALFVWYTELCG
jgi:hypothetical protein